MHQNETRKEISELEAKEKNTAQEPPLATAHEGNGVSLSEPANNRGKGRRVIQRAERTNITHYPQISPERRKSYLSIAERRKYYNRSKTSTRKPELSQRDVLRPLETTNRPVIAREKVLLMNEIRQNFTKVPRHPDKNSTQSQRLVVGMLTNEPLPKTDFVNRTVIYSQVEFGQKLSLRRPVTRVQDLRNDNAKRRKDKEVEELSVIKSTNKFYKDAETQSTRLVKVEKNYWSTTKNPKEVEADNFVMQWKKNSSGIEKSGKYLKNAKYVTGTLEHFSEETTEKQNFSLLPSSSSETQTVTEMEITTSGIPGSETTMTTDSITTVEISSETSSTSSSYFADGVRPPPAAATTTASTSFSVTSMVPLKRKFYVPSVEYKTRFNYTRILQTQTENVAVNSSPQPRTTLSAVADHRPSPTKPAEASDQMRTWLYDSRKRRPTQGTTATTETPSTKIKHPLTIEINENNKRILSEMFSTTTEFEPKEDSTRVHTDRVSEQRKVSGRGKEKINWPEVTTVTDSSSGIAVILTTSPSPLNLEDFSEDHKSVGTSFNTKFYVIPNVTKTEVIKIVETEEEDEKEILVAAQNIGMAVYVLAAFGFVPLLLALIFGAKFFVQRHRRKDDCDSDIRSDVSGNENRTQHGKGSSELKKSPSSVTTTTLVATTRLPRVHHWEDSDKVPIRNWEFPRSKLKLLTILGQGNFGQVWKAEAYDMSGTADPPRLVAVKTVKEGATEKEHGELIKELEIMQQIGSHPNIVALLGCCTDQEPYYLIIEYVMRGKLLTYLRENRSSENYYNISSDNDALTSRDLTVFAYCVARGMEYLNSKGIIHRDLAARNVLVDHNKLCKIADFGMSRSVRDTEDGRLYEERQHKGALPIRWMAPESLTYSLFTNKSDVWSFGIVVWEIVTLGSTPYPSMGAREVMRKVREGYRLERPHHCTHELYQLISRCWAHDPNKRPDFGDLRRELKNLLDDTSKDGIYVDLDSFAATNRFHLSNTNKTKDLRLLKRHEFKTLKQLNGWEGQDWAVELKKNRSKRNRNNGKGTVTLTGQGSFTVNSRILEKEFKLV